MWYSVADRVQGQEVAGVLEPSTVDNPNVPVRFSRLDRKRYTGVFSRQLKVHMYRGNPSHKISDQVHRQLKAQQPLRHSESFLLNQVVLHRFVALPWPLSAADMSCIIQRIFPIISSVSWRGANHGMHTSTFFCLRINFFSEPKQHTSQSNESVGINYWSIPYTAVDSLLLRIQDARKLFLVQCQHKKKSDVHLKLQQNKQHRAKSIKFHNQHCSTHQRPGGFCSGQARGSGGWVAHNKGGEMSARAALARARRGSKRNCSGRTAAAVYSSTNQPPAASSTRQQHLEGGFCPGNLLYSVHFHSEKFRRIFAGERGYRAGV